MPRSPAGLADRTILDLRYLMNYTSLPKNNVPAIPSAYLTFRESEIPVLLLAGSSWPKDENTTPVPEPKHHS